MHPVLSKNSFTFYTINRNNCILNRLSTRRVTKQVPLEEDTSGSSIPASNNVHKGPANLLETVDKVLDSSSDD